MPEKYSANNPFRPKNDFSDVSGGGSTSAPKQSGYSKGNPFAKKKRAGGFLLPVASGLTLGASDEILGGIEGLSNIGEEGGFSAGYERGKQKVRQAGKDFADDNPVLSPALELGAGILAPGFGAAGFIKGAASTAGKIGRSAAAGAGLGGASGAAYSTEGNRTAGAATGAALGGVLGGTLASAGKVLGGAANQLGLRSEKASRKLGLQNAVRSLQDDGVDASSLVDNADEAVQLGVPTKAYDLGGDQSLRTARAAEAVSGGMRQGLVERQAGQGDRIFDHAEKALGVKGRDLHEVSQEVTKRARQKADPLYEAARNHGPLQSQRLEELLQRPALQKALAKGRTKAIDEGEALGDPVDIRVIDYAKRALDDRISKAIRAGAKDDVRILTKLKREMLDIVDEEVPVYGEARKAWGGEKNYEKAVTMGARVFSASKRPDASIAKRLAALSDTDKDGFRIGVLGAIRDVIRSSSTSSDKVKRLMGTPKAREALSEVIGGVDKNSSFAKAMQLEGSRFGAKSFILNHSQTANILKDIESLADLAMGMLADGATGNVGNAAMKGVKAFLGNRKRAGGGKIARETGRYMNAEPGTEDFTALAEAMAGYRAQKPIELPVDRMMNKVTSRRLFPELSLKNRAGAIGDQPKLAPLNERTVEAHAEALRQAGKGKAADNLSSFMQGSVVRRPVFRGDFDVDAMGNRFKKSKNTSGGFYFTEDPHIAGGDPNITAAEQKVRGYAGKYDHAAGSTPYADYFSIGEGKKKVPMSRAWWTLSPEQRERFAKVVQETTQDDEGAFIREAGNVHGNGGVWPGMERQYHGDWFKVANEAWLNSGSLFDDEARFSHLLDEAGIPHSFKDPRDGAPGVTPVYLNIKRPVVAENPPEDFKAALARAAKHDRTRPKHGGVDAWDKDALSFRDWYENRFKYSQEKEVPEDRGMWATVIPDKAMKIARELGYDGFQHIGGRTTEGKPHNVFIALEPNQIKSAIGNKGGYNPNTDVITGHSGLKMLGAIAGTGAAVGGLGALRARQRKK